MKVPYTFPHKSRQAIYEYLAGRGAYYDQERYAFAWNVKTHTASFYSNALRLVHPDLDPAFDAAWEALLESDNSNLFWYWCEGAGRGIAEGEWTSYPGDDQGDWDFSFAGRSGGWLILRKWRGYDMRDVYPNDFLDPELWPWADLVAFYRGIRCADSDFTPQKAAKEVMFQAARYRGEVWEVEKREMSDARARKLADSIAAARPDLEPCYV
jgi:hypothetical protein